MCARGCDARQSREAKIELLSHYILHLVQSNAQQVQIKVYETMLVAVVRTKSIPVVPTPAPCQPTMIKRLVLHAATGTGSARANLYHHVDAAIRKFEVNMQHLPRALPCKRVEFLQQFDEYRRARLDLEIQHRNDRSGPKYSLGMIRNVAHSTAPNSPLQATAPNATAASTSTLLPVDTAPARSPISFAIVQRTNAPGCVVNELEKDMRKSMPGANVVRVQTIDAPALKKHYKRLCSDTKPLRGHDFVGEKFLYHGTRSKSPKEVLTEHGDRGLDPRCASKGTFFGACLYLAEKWRYARHYAYRNDKGNLEILVVEANVGHPANLGQVVSPATMNAYQPPVMINTRPPTLYDSVVGGPHCPRQSGDGENSSIIYGIYRSEQTLPTFIVEVEDDILPEDRKRCNRCTNCTGAKRSRNASHA